MFDKKIYVVFSGQSELPFVRFLRFGFKHCYAVIHDGRRWIIYDPLSHITDITVMEDIPADYDVPALLTAQGQKVLSVPMMSVTPKPMPPGFFTCVEAIKRLCGIRHLFIQTPWQLYRYLKHFQKKER